MRELFMEATESSLLIKICGITNEEDASLAVRAGATALGFNFYAKSPRYVMVSKAREIAAAVTGEYLKVGVFVNASREELEEYAHAVPLDVLQLHGTCPSDLPPVYRIWRAIPGGQVPVAREPWIEAYLLDSVSPEFGGSGQAFDWESARGFPFQAILAGGLHGENVNSAIRIVEPWGVDACSRLESRPGKKDPEKLTAFIKAAREASRALQDTER